MSARKGADLGVSLTVKDEGVSLTNRPALDFVGPGVAVTDDAAGGRTVVAIPGVGGASSDTEWTAYTPTATGLTVGNGTLVGRYKHIGRVVHAQVTFILGSTSAVGTFPPDARLTLPIAAQTYQPTLGIARFFDTSAAKHYIGWWRDGYIGYEGNQQYGSIDSALPFTWATGDVIWLNITYEAASSAPFPGGSGPAIAVRVYRSTAGVTVPHATWTAIAFDAESFDENGMHDLATNTSRVTCIVAGKYQVNAALRWGAVVSTGNYRVAGIRQFNSAAALIRVSESTLTGSSGQLDSNWLSDIFDMAVGDYLELYGYQETGSTKAVWYGPENTWMSAILIPGNVNPEQVIQTQSETYSGSDPVVNANTQTDIQGLGPLFIPVADGILHLKATGVANSPSGGGIQGAYINPRLGLNYEDGYNTTGGTAGVNRLTPLSHHGGQIVQTPLVNAAVEGEALYLVQKGVQYRFDYHLRSGGGGSQVTFSNMQTTASLTTVGGTALAVQDEGVTLAQRGILNFVGAGITATDDAANNRTIVTVPGVSSALETWHEIGAGGEPAFTNSWVNYGSGYNTAAFYKDRGRVYLKGLIKDGSANSAAFTLPAGYRPANQFYYRKIMGSGAGAGAIQVNPDGTVNIYVGSGSNVEVALDDVSFRAD